MHSCGRVEARHPHIIVVINGLVSWRLQCADLRDVILWIVENRLLRMWPNKHLWGLGKLFLGCGLSDFSWRASTGDTSNGNNDSKGWSLCYGYGMVFQIFPGTDTNCLIRLSFLYHTRLLIGLPCWAHYWRGDNYYVQVCSSSSRSSSMAIDSYLDGLL